MKAIEGLSSEQVATKLFINPDRPGYPDVDTDFSYLRRNEVIEYVIDKYGADNVAQIGTYTRLSSKSVIKDMGRVHGVDFQELNKITAAFPEEADTITEAFEIDENFLKHKEKYPKLFEDAIKIEGMPRSSSTHACGVLITPEPINTSIPIGVSKLSYPLSQLEGDTLESLGYVKFDFLGLKTLSVLEIGAELVERDLGIKIDFDNLSLDDDSVYKTIKDGKTLGIFQLESEGMTNVFKGLNKVGFEDLIAGVALYRPGPMAHIPEYQKRANGYVDIEYFHEDAKSILSPTYGILIYQEQLMELAGVFGGYTPGERDNLRKATGKKSQEVMDKVLPELKERILNNGYTEDVAQHIVKLIEPFVGYGL